MKNRLDKSVSLQELQYMREEEGLSNTEIADRLGVSTAVIYKYLGKGGPRKPYTKKEIITIDLIAKKLSDVIGYPCNYTPLDQHMIGRYCGRCNPANSEDCWRKVIQMWKEWE